MKLIILVLSVLISLTYANVDFDAYMAQYQKSYGSVSEQQKRKAIFDSNLKKIDEYNKWAEANGFDSRQGITNFTDLDYSEFVKKYTGYVAGSSAALNLKTAEIVFSPKAVAASWDWRAQGKVNAIKNQGNCGSCWAFAITAIHEVYYAIQKNKLAAFSEQELLDCAPYTNGCNGADPIDAANFVLGYGHELSSDYPYVAKKYSCTYKSSKVVSTPKYGYRWTGTEANLKAVVSQTGAVAIAIYASSVFQNFKSTGILADSSCNGITRGSQVNHAVTIVGYGTLNGRDYWLVRNSWGTGWGDAGYIKLPYGSNYCGIMVEPVFFSATRYN